MSENLTKKYRPLKFSDVVGQDISVRTLAAALGQHKLPPAYLFYGTRGCGKTTAARLMAMALNCQKQAEPNTPTGIEPCGVCQSCKDILGDASEYLVEVDGATYGKVEDVRNLMASIRYVVPDEHYKVIIIDECHGLTKAAWDSTLKTIEEPPPNVLFIFCTTEIQKVIPTVKSRCTVVGFPGVADLVIKNALIKIAQAENVTYDEAAMDKIVKVCGGSVREAQMILEGFIRMGKVSEADVTALYQAVDAQTITTYFNAVVDKDIKSACNLTSGWVRQGVAPATVVTSLLEHLRNMIMDFNVQDSFLKKVLHAQREKIGDARVAQWIEFFYLQQQYIRDFPMEYTLILDLITIKLIDSLNVRLESAAKKKKEVKEEAPAVAESPATAVIAQAPVKDKKPAALNPTAVNKLQQTVNALVQGTTPGYDRVTMTTPKGFTFDIVVAPENAVSRAYILGSEVDVVVDYAGERQYVIAGFAHTSGARVIAEFFMYLRVTLQNANGATLDIVQDPRFAVSDKYLLFSDVAAALIDFPNKVGNYIHVRNKDTNS